MMIQMNDDFIHRYCRVSAIGEIIIKNAILSIHNLTDEKATTISEKVQESAKRFNIQDKIFGLVADNAPVNFGHLHSNTQGRG